MVGRVYPDYRVATAVQENNMHLHNVPMQIAAERGLPALVLWLWFIGAALVALRPLLVTPAHAGLRGHGDGRDRRDARPPGSSSTTSATPSS